MPPQAPAIDPVGDKGQSTVEAALALPSILLGLVLAGSLIYRSTLYFLADYHLHEAVICAEYRRISRCEQLLKDNLRSIIFFKEKLNIKLQKDFLSTKGSVEIELRPKLKIQKTYGKK